MSNNQLVDLLQEGQPGQIFDHVTGRLLQAIVTVTISNSAIVIDQERVQHVFDRATGAGRGLNIREIFQRSE